MNTTAIELIGFGKCLGKTLQTNKEVAARLGITEDEIVAKSGIEQRYLAKSESASSLGAQALKEALKNSSVEPHQLSGIIVATFSGDYIYPNTASRLCKDIGISDCFAYDVQANCAGFQVALANARDILVSNPDYKYVAVVGIAKQSPYINPDDINIAYFFSDAASAAIVTRREGVTGGLLTPLYKTNSTNYELVRLRGGGSSFPIDEQLLTNDRKALFYEQAGLGVWKEVVVEMPTLVKKVLAREGWTADDVDLVLMHQANLRLIEFIMSRLRIPMSKTVTNVESIGNTADASLGLALWDAKAQDRLVPGSKVILASVGAGFVYAVTPYIVPSR